MEDVDHGGGVVDPRNSAPLANTLANGARDADLFPGDATLPGELEDVGVEVHAVDPPQLEDNAIALEIGNRRWQFHGGSAWAAWAWNVTWPTGGGPLFATMQNVVTFDPNIFAPQGASRFTLAPQVGFDPTQAVSMQAAELAVGPSGWALFPPVPVVGGVKPWNYWGNLVIVPEPAEMAGVMGVALVGLAFLRRLSG